ncbi:major facilitator family transporter [Ameyamaea chiangmaiensis NBRC 103196]|uniref:MFS transporter n=4 Tax=Acetobacterales TaxID=3120395 RepID=A0A850PAV1_9PROT|nr:MFS transporter [Gluconacetobacter dulcium]MBO1361083.1 MFS transporter [Acetobacter sacchari]MBS4076356.1 MFS transporter [Ameyamaea chiangmaiensis]NVN41078.1 MFS transporter [Ameyamaea chiangmaiensis]GBQ65367.1 major facilitator family transporter [Ameyamaea chiangmaiensis NBRC 103196]
MIDPRILLLAFGTFAIGTEGYAIAGLLPMISADLHVSVAACGQLVTIFALSYALGGPVLVAWLDSFPRKRLIILALVGFSLANLLAAFAQSWWFLALARVLAALTAALFMAPASAAAVALSPPEKRGHALSITATGNALALAMGAPLGTIAGTVWGWQGAFMLVASLGGAAAVGIGLMLPSVPPAPIVPFQTRFALLRQSSVRRGLAVSFGLFVCALTAYTYLTPLAHQAAGMDSRWVAALMAVFGAVATVAGVAAGSMINRYGSRRILFISIGIMVGLFSLMGGLATLHHSGRAETAVMILLAALWGGAWWSGGIAQQHRMTDMAPGQHAAILALHYSMQFFGISVGGALGGLILAFMGIPDVAFGAAVTGMITLIGL